MYFFQIVAIIVGGDDLYWWINPKVSLRKTCHIKMIAMHPCYKLYLSAVLPKLFPLRIFFVLHYSSGEARDTVYIVLKYFNTLIYPLTKLNTMCCKPCGLMLKCPHSYHIFVFVLRRN